MGNIESKQSKMQLIINSLSGDDDLKDTFFYIVEYYSKYKKISYSEALRMLHVINKEEESAQIFDYMLFRLEMLVSDDFFPIFISYAKERNSELNIDEGELKNFILKIQDHVSLEIIRFENNLAEANKSYNGFKSELNNFSKFLNRKTSDLEVYSKEIESRVNAGVTTVLGIFAAFIIAAFGGITVYGDTMAALQGTSIYHIIFMTLLFGLILFDICFLLIYSVAKISNRNIGVVIDDKYRGLYYENPLYYVRHFIHHNGEIDASKKRKLFIKCCLRDIWVFFAKIYYYFLDGFKRFPLLFMFNMMMIVGMVIIIQFVYRTGGFNEFLINNDILRLVLNGELFS